MGWVHTISSFLAKLAVLIILFLSGDAHAAAGSSDYIPPQAFTHKATIQSELDTFFPAIPTYNYIPSLIEHESCISLKHSRCWKSTSELLTKREQGVGLGQITRTFKPDGTVKADSLQSMKSIYRQHLAEAKWSTIKERPDLQIRIIVLMIRDNYKALYSVKDPLSRLQMTDAAYNGGLGWILKERRVCGLAKGCDPGLWFGHVENHCLRSRKPLYSGRSVCDIAKHHPYDVFKNRLPKYERRYFTATNKTSS